MSVKQFSCPLLQIVGERTIFDVLEQPTSGLEMGRPATMWLSTLVVYADVVCID